MSLPQVFNQDNTGRLAYGTAAAQLQLLAARIRRISAALGARIGLLAPIAWLVLLGSLLYQVGLIVFG